MATGNDVTVRSPQQQTGVNKPMMKAASRCYQCQQICHYPVVAVQKYAKVSVFCTMSCFAKHVSET